MGSTRDSITARAKRVAGSLTGDDELKREGRLDETEARMKAGVEKVRSAVSDGVDSVMPGDDTTGDGALKKAGRKVKESAETATDRAADCIDSMKGKVTR